VDSAVSVNRQEQLGLINRRCLVRIKARVWAKARAWADARPVRAEAATDAAAAKAGGEAATANLILVYLQFQDGQQQPAAAATAAGFSGGRYS
jgi:hypothetical protein